MIFITQTRVQNSTKLKKIIQDSKDALMESEIRLRMQPLKDQLVKSINHIHGVFGLHVFIALCRGFWDRMGQVINRSINIFPITNIPKMNPIAMCFELLIVGCAQLSRKQKRKQNMVQGFTCGCSCKFVFVTPLHFRLSVELISLWVFCLSFWTTSLYLKCKVCLEIQCKKMII